MKIRILTPSEVIMEQEAVHITAEDTTGSLGIRENHATLVTSLVPGIVRIRSNGGSEQYVAVNGGMLLVNSNEVEIVSRQAVAGNDLTSLENGVVTEFEKDEQEAQKNRAAFEKLRISFLRGVVEMDKAAG